jgi:hypothetical protein
LAVAVYWAAATSKLFAEAQYQQAGGYSKPPPPTPQYKPQPSYPPQPPAYPKPQQGGYGGKSYGGYEEEKYPVVRTTFIRFIFDQSFSEFIDQ